MQQNCASNASIFYDGFSAKLISASSRAPYKTLISGRKPLNPWTMCRLFFLIIPVLTLAFPLGVSAEPMRLPQGCVPGAGPEQRQRCDDAVAQQLNSSSQSTPLGGGWQLIKTRDPNGNADIVAAVRTADTAKSDLNLAGLSLRCAGNGTEVVLTLLERQPRTSHPMVALTVGSDRVLLEASVNQSGESLVLPQAASALAAGAWLSAPELAVEIATTPAPTRGTIPLKGLANAVQTLRSSCALR
jgi:hypothetical protein